MAVAKLTLAQLRELLHYDPKTGVFTQKTHRKGSGLTPGQTVGCLSSEGYVYIGLHYRRYRAHRLAWLWTTGNWPEAGIDHINGNRADNRWVNLRPATQAQNGGNARRSSANTTGLKGVSKWGNRWQAGITQNYKRRHLGLFDTPEAAHAAYMRAAKKQFGKFARAA